MKAILNDWITFAELHRLVPVERRIGKGLISFVGSLVTMLGALTLTTPTDHDHAPRMDHQSRMRISVRITEGTEPDYSQLFP